MTPTTLPPAGRGSGCPPAATLDAMSAGEVVPAAVQDHTDACPSCSAQLAALRTAADAFQRARPADRFLRQLERREASSARPAAGRWRWRRLVPALAVAVPALLAVLLIPRWQDQQVVKLKGGGFRVAIARAGAAPELAGTDAVVRAGDALRFSYEADRDGHLLVLELDGRGTASVLHPFGADRSAPLPAGRRDFLPGSVVLDDAPGPELLVAVFSERPLEAAPLLAALRDQAGRPEPALACDGCRVTALRLRKVP